MSSSPVSRALQQFVEDEMLRAPLLFDLVVDGTLQHIQDSVAGQSKLQRQIMGELMTALQTQRATLASYYLRSLQAQVQVELARETCTGAGSGAAVRGALDGKSATLELVDEVAVAADVELSHAIEAIRSVAEYELRELQTFISAMVGDMDVARDYNPFRAETHAQALWAAAQGLALSRGHQVALMRHAGAAMAQQLRKSYAATSSRLESMGIEPAAYRTVILPGGNRRSNPRSMETTYNPDLHRMRDTMPARVEEPRTLQGLLPTGGTTARPRERWHDVAAESANPVDRQAVELVSRLFEAMQNDERLPADVTQLIARLHGPAMRLTLRDGSMLDEGRHPLWRFINRLAYEAEMTPDMLDPERAMLVKLAQGAIDQVACEPEQHTGLYSRAMDRLEDFLRKRLARRVAAAAVQIESLQQLEGRLGDEDSTPTTLHGMLDLDQLATVPMQLLPEPARHPAAGTQPAEWLAGLAPGVWVRIFLHGHWVQAQLLWQSRRREIWLLGDGASDTTWAVRRGALVMMHGERLAKTLRQRSIVGSAAARVQERLTQPAAA